MKHNKIQYAFLLIDFQTPKIIKDIQDKIDKDDIYHGEEGEETTVGTTVWKKKATSPFARALT